MRRRADGRSVIEFRDIDLAYGFRSFRWFWIGFAILVLTWLIAGPAFAETCFASQYGIGDGYHGKPVACRSFGRFNTYATSPYTVAHKTRACGSAVSITNLANGRSISAVVTDRGPFVRGRCVDLGRAGATAIGMGGTAKVRVE